MSELLIAFVVAGFVEAEQEAQLAAMDVGFVIGFQYQPYT